MQYQGSGNFIAVTACLRRCSVAFSYEGNLYEVNEYADAASGLVYLAYGLIESHNINLKNIDGIITASGPGSFTGIRAAQSFAKGLALSLKLPSASVSYFDVILDIFTEKDQFKDRQIMVAIKSEKNQIYYRCNRAFAATDGIAPIETFVNLLEENAVIVGDIIEIPHLKNISTYHVDNFRAARHLLNFSHCVTATSKIVPLYFAHSPIQG